MTFTPALQARALAALTAYDRRVAPPAALADELASALRAVLHALDVDAPEVARAHYLAMYAQLQRERQLS